MFTKENATILQSRLTSLPLVVAEKSLRRDLDELVADVLPFGSVALVDDNDTAAALGDTLAQALKSRYRLARISLGRMPKADDETLRTILHRSEGADLYIAVGSGTINDLCKYASHQRGKPYIVFPTAASMNGYLSANASITVEGYKSTLPAHLPQAVFCDWSVIASAPARLSKSGLGDSLARATAQTDWLLSHLLLATSYDETPFTLLAAIEPQMIASARGIARGDSESIALLMQVLLLSGLGMTIAGGSYPASQSEHLLAHAYEMLDPHALATLHGEQIGVTTLHAAGLQQRLLSHPPAPPALDFPAEAMLRLFGPSHTQKAQKEFRAKQERIEEAGLTQAALKSRWPDIAHRLSHIALPPDMIELALKEADAPRHPAQLGWNDAAYTEAKAHARYLRDRFTCLDLV